MSTVGDKLGRYELITRIGQGGMAEVQLAIQRGPAGFEKLVVVKLVHENLASQKTFVDMLLDEARMAALVKHPNVVDIYDLGEEGGRYFIAMEYLEGEPLLAVLRAGREGKRLDVQSTARLIADTAEGLEAAHELRSMSGELIELVHHDISLGNIVVLYDGQVKLVDFGVAKASQSASNAGGAKVQGKFSYMAPEKLRGGNGDRRSDIWSLGCVMWEALTLRRLFKGGNDTDTMKQVLESTVQAPSLVNGDVPVAFDAIVLKALEREPENRYASAAQMAEDIEDVLREMNYARKNAVIARYMQDAFKDHIIARKKLLQEVSSKGRASAAILEAAFDEPLAQGSPIEGAAADLFSIKFRPTLDNIAAHVPPYVAPLIPVPPPIAFLPLTATPTPLPTPTPTPTPLPLPSPTPTPLPLPLPPPPPAPPAEFSPEEKVPTGSKPLDESLDKWSAVASSNREHAPRVVPDSPVLAPRPKAASLPVAPAPKRSPVVLVVIGAIAIIGIIVAAFVMSSHSAPEPAPPPPPKHPLPSQLPVAPDASVASVASVDASESGPAIDAAIASSGLDAGVPLDAGRKGPTTPPLDLDATFKLGLQALVRGDARSALAQFKKVQAANASYAPAWRGLGLAYEKTGDTGQARAAYQRYLQLSPSAPDAAAIKKRLEALGP